MANSDSTRTNRPGGSNRPLRAGEHAVFALLLLWCAAQIIAGLLYRERPVVAVGIGSGAVGAVVVIVAALRRSLLPAIYGVLLATAVGLLVSGSLGASQLIGPGVLAIVIVGAMAPIATALSGRADDAADVDTLGVLREIHEHTMLSDGAKRIIFRERELALLRRSIEHDIAAGEYNVALTLCDEMAGAFGYREEAETFRAEILQARQERYDAAVRTALEHFDATLADRNWAAVHDEAARIRRLYGDSHLVQDLEQRILQARHDHKNELEARFLRAAEHEDVEEAMELLRQLDRYLDPSEAERLAEVAEGVVVKHRENLGVQFKLAVNDHRWSEAVHIGETIVEEFPNTQMATEVRPMIDVLRTRAEQATVGGTQA